MPNPTSASTRSPSTSTCSVMCVRGRIAVVPNRTRAASGVTAKPSVSSAAAKSRSARAIAAAPARDELRLQTGEIEPDWAPEENVQVFEWNVRRMREMQRVERRARGRSSARVANPLEIRVEVEGGFRVGHQRSTRGIPDALTSGRRRYDPAILGQEKEMKLAGSCSCGAVKFHARVPQTYPSHALLLLDSRRKTRRRRIRDQYHGPGGVALRARQEVVSAFRARIRDTEPREDSSRWLAGTSARNAAARCGCGTRAGRTRLSVCICDRHDIAGAPRRRGDHARLRGLLVRNSQRPRPCAFPDVGVGPFA